jgi:hypothetical protein
MNCCNIYEKSKTIKILIANFILLRFVFEWFLFENNTLLSIPVSSMFKIRKKQLLDGVESSYPSKIDLLKKYYTLKYVRYCRNLAFR